MNHKIKTKRKKRKVNVMVCMCVHNTLSEWIGMFDKREFSSQRT